MEQYKVITYNDHNASTRSYVIGPVSYDTAKIILKLLVKNNFILVENSVEPGKIRDIYYLDDCISFRIEKENYEVVSQNKILVSGDFFLDNMKEWYDAHQT